MSEEPSESPKGFRFSVLGPPLSLLIVLSALYVRKPEFRRLVDEKCPWIKENVGKYVTPSDGKVARVPVDAPASGAGPTRSPRSPVTEAPDARAPAPASGPDAPEPVKRIFDLQTVCADPTLWPKTVVLKRNVTFPAVLNGRVIGTLLAPKGSEARLVTIRSGKLGLEYHGGGAWLDVGSTDFEERARLAFH